MAKKSPAKQGTKILCETLLAWGCAWAKRTAARDNQAATQTHASGR